MKKLVKIYLTEDRRLVIREPNGTEYFIEIYNGGGYYTDILLYTTKELLDKKRRAIRMEKEETARRIKARELYEQEQNKRKWYQFWK